MYDLDADPAYREIPDRIMGGLVRWGDHGRHPGGFLTAVLEGDLLNAVCLSDSEAIQHLPAIVKFVYNQMPAGCHAMKKSPPLVSTIMADWQGRFEPGPNV
jgi:hypothetical protein